MALREVFYADLPRKYCTCPSLLYIIDISVSLSGSASLKPGKNTGLLSRCEWIHNGESTTLSLAEPHASGSRIYLSPCLNKKKRLTQYMEFL